LSSVARHATPIAPVASTKRTFLPASRRRRFPGRAGRSRPGKDDQTRCARASIMTVRSPKAPELPQAQGSYILSATLWTVASVWRAATGTSKQANSRQRVIWSAV